MVKCQGHDHPSLSSCCYNIAWQMQHWWERDSFSSQFQGTVYRCEKSGWWEFETTAGHIYTADGMHACLCSAFSPSHSPGACWRKWCSPHSKHIINDTVTCGSFLNSVTIAPSSVHHHLGSASFSNGSFQTGHWHFFTVFLSQVTSFIDL